METRLADGKVRAVGVSNFMVEHLTRLLDRCAVVPAVNQIEVHPYFAQRELQDFAAAHGVVTQAWSPIGGLTFYRDGRHGSTLADPLIGAIAKAHGKSAALVMPRWGLQEGRSVIPKSTNVGALRRTSTCSTSNCRPRRSLRSTAWIPINAAVLTPTRSPSRRSGGTSQMPEVEVT